MYVHYQLKGQLRPIQDRVVVSELNAGERFSKAGILIPNDDGKERGIRPRWGQVYAIGPKQKDVKVGEWVLVEHGRWTRGIPVTDANNQELIIRMIDPTSIMAVSDTPPCPSDL